MSNYSIFIKKNHTCIYFLSNVTFLLLFKKLIESFAGKGMQQNVCTLF